MASFQCNTSCELLSAVHNAKMAIGNRPAVYALARQKQDTTKRSDTTQVVPA